MLYKSKIDSLETYIAPEAKVFALEMQGLICTSGEYGSSGAPGTNPREFDFGEF